MKLRRNAKIDLLRGMPLFAGCSRQELAEIATIADEMYLPQDTTLIEEGERGREFFVLVEGTVIIRRKGRKLGTMSGPDFVGEIALITDAPRSATVTTTSPVRLLVITAQAFQRLLADTASLRPKVLAALADRVAATSP